MGKHGKAPGEFDPPHGIALDSVGRVYVADRANDRIQIIEAEGRFIAEWSQFGRPSEIAIGKNDKIYVADSQSESNDPKRPTYNPGFEQGIRIGSAKDGNVVAFIPIPPPPDAATNAPEGVAADASGSVYGADVVLKDVRKYVKQ